VTERRILTTDFTDGTDGTELAFLSVLSESSVVQLFLSVVEHAECQDTDGALKRFNSKAQKYNHECTRIARMNSFVKIRVDSWATLERKTARHTSDEGLPALFLAAHQDGFDHRFDLDGHLFGGDAVAGFEPSAGGAEDRPGGGGREQ
jgi:hypothetical protein